MVKIEYVGETDTMTLVKRHDVFFAELTEDGRFYKVMNKCDEEVYLHVSEVIEYE